ncbi:neutral zinc metallopeptidase [Nocardioides sp. Kera G14]|uniref:KPN_02809 family neutral zinc metallopeptidase n=1 Tax=Nocardioides sp. Kera G14 TaxID=2884264 RepID=UPI001D10FE84|nr:neutral zinc metallopeptidase [Nocardioides sp. Kera G14]UDY25134.1 neutral zinc metallopeptidase [Nocardioides sp. Kera G14]
MRFNPKARLDNSRVQDVGSGGGGGLGGGGLSGLPIPTGKMGGGIGGIILIIALVIISQCTGVDLTGGVLSGSTTSLDASRFSGASVAGTGSGTHDFSSCQTGDDANNSEDCALVAVENSLGDYWSKELGSQFQYENGVHVFEGQVSTQGCGTATEDVGPFYCPTDQTIYLDTAFYQDMLEGQLGGQDAPFVRAYVIAHEYGHHIQNLLGIMNKVKTQQGQNSDSVKLELQADCFAGMWAQAATTASGDDNEPLISDLTDTDISDAIGAAHDVGDDYIQNKMQGGTNPESWTHGSSAQRESEFKKGMASNNDISACDTGLGVG